MPYRCKICGKSCLLRADTLKHVMVDHLLSEEEAKTYVYHTNPSIEKQLERQRKLQRRWKQIDNIRYACIYGRHYPSGRCLCPICNVEHSKSYYVYYDSPDLYVAINVCRNCFKALANGPQSVFSKSVYDGNFESNK